MLRVALIVGALLVAVLAGVMVNGYLAAQRAEILAAQSQPAAPALPTAEVLVVTADVPIAGTVTAGTLGWQPWPEANLHPNYITRAARADALDKLAGAAARQPLFAGEPVTEAKLVKRDGAGFLAALLDAGRRAVTLKVDESSGMAGLMLPGDRVDVILTHTLTGSGTGGERAVSETIARDLRVLAVDQVFTSDAQGGATPPKTVTLEVEPEQAQAVMLGRNLGTLSLALRSSFGDGGRVHVQIATHDTDVSQVLRQGRAAGSSPGGAREGSKTITVFKGATAETTTVTR